MYYQFLLKRFLYSPQYFQCLPFTGAFPCAFEYSLIRFKGELHSATVMALSRKFLLPGTPPPSEKCEVAISVILCRSQSVTSNVLFFDLMQSLHRDGHVLFHLLALCEIHVVFKCSLDTTISHFKHDYATENTDHQEGKLPSHDSLSSANFNILVLCTHPSPSLFWPTRQHIHLFLYSLFFNCAFDTFYSCFYMIMSCKFSCSVLSPSLATHWLQQINILELTTSSKITATNAEIAP